MGQEAPKTSGGLPPSRSPLAPLLLFEFRVNAKNRRLMLGGFFGTVLMTAFLGYVSKISELNLDFPSMLAAGILGKEIPLYGPSWWFGLFVHFYIGTVLLPLFYGRVFINGVYGPPSVRGFQYGTLVWLLFIFLWLPFIGKGTFAAETPRPFLVCFWTLIAHWGYGTTLGAISVKQPRPRQFHTPAWHG